MSKVTHYDDKFVTEVHEDIDGVVHTNVVRKRTESETARLEKIVETLGGRSNE